MHSLQYPDLCISSIANDFLQYIHSISFMTIIASIPHFIKDTLLNVFLERYTHFFMDEEITEYADNYINIDVTFDVTLVKQANR